MIISFLLLLGIAKAGDDDTTAVRVPKWNVRAQFAGMQGLFSTGAMWNYKDGRIQAGLLYGYAPPGDGSKTFHAAIVRLTGSWFPTQKELVKDWHFSPILSVSLLTELGGIAYLGLPDDLPDDYYGTPHAYHPLFAVGLRAGRFGGKQGWMITAETVALDTHLWYAVSQQHVSFTEVWSLALGAEFHF